MAKENQSTSSGDSVIQSRPSDEPVTGNKDQKKNQAAFQSGRSQFLARLLLLIITGLAGSSIALTAWLYVRHPSAILLSAMLLAIIVTVIDLAWLFAYRRLRGAARIQAVICWLIYHTAWIPMAILANRFAAAGLKTYLLSQLAILILGALPVLGVVWLDHRMRQIKGS